MVGSCKLTAASTSEIAILHNQDIEKLPTCRTKLTWKETRLDMRLRIVCVVRKHVKLTQCMHSNQGNMVGYIETTCAVP